MATFYITKPKFEIYNEPITGKDKKETLLAVIDKYAPRAYEEAKIKKTMSYEEIEAKFADDYLFNYDKPLYNEYLEVRVKYKGKLRLLF